MTKKKNLTTFMIAIMIMLFSLPANAQGTVGYAKWDELHTTLTFYGGESVPEGAYELNTGNYNPGWYANDIKGSVTKVVFDKSFKDVRPTSCYRWFSGFGGLTTIEGIENLNTEEVTNMSSMFRECSSLTSLDLSSFNTAEVTTMYQMFYSCSGLTSLDLSSFNTANVTTMGSMFHDCNKLTSLTLSSFFNTANVTSMSYMFNKCRKLTSLDLSSFNTANVTNMRSMFHYCQELTSLDLSSFNTANVTDMSSMFNYCPKLTSLDLSSFNTANVTSMSYMFNYCQELTALDLSNFNTANVTTMSNMFEGCSGLKTIYVSDDFTTSDGTSGSFMFKDCTNLVGAAPYNSGKTGKSMANCTSGYFTESNLTPYVKWDASTKVLTFKVANYIKGTQGEWKLNEGANDPGWVGEVYDVCEKVVFTPSFKQAKPTSCYRWFLGFSIPTTIEGIENLNTEKVTNMSEMFNSCSGLTSLDLSSFNTAKVTNMNGMFGGSYGLISLDLSSFNTAKVENMTNMFDNCYSLTTIYASDGFTTGEDISSDGMFESCFVLKGATPWDITKTGKDMANYKTGYFKTYFTLGENKVELCGTPLTTESLDLSGDYDFTPKYEFKAKTATYSRDLSTSGSTWFSLCLPFAYTPANFNFTAYKLKGASADAVEIEEITETIAAGTPVLFKFKDGVVDVDKKIEIFATGANIVNAPVVDGSTAVNGPNGSSLQLCGTYQAKSFSSEDNNAFILLNNKLMNPAKMLENKNVSKVSVKPFRAYMTLTAPAQTSSARAFSIGHGGEGNEGTTAIDLLNSVATDDAEYYDINGRRIDAPAKGVNIVRRGNKTMKLIIK